jgi:hypothetical protein
MIGRMSPGIAVRLVFLCLVGAASSARLSAPMSGLACESDIEGETMELGHRQLDVTAPPESQISLCADECEQKGCTAFHVMQSHGCTDEVGPDVCVPWAECTFFSRCEAMVSDNDEAPDWTSTAYFLSDHADAADSFNAPSTARRQMMEMPAMASMGLMGSMASMGSVTSSPMPSMVPIISMLRPGDTLPEVRSIPDMSSLP